MRAVCRKHPIDAVNGCTAFFHRLQVIEQISSRKIVLHLNKLKSWLSFTLILFSNETALFSQNFKRLEYIKIVERHCYCVAETIIQRKNIIPIITKEKNCNENS